MTIGAKVLYSEMPDVQAFSQHGRLYRHHFLSLPFGDGIGQLQQHPRGFPDESICSDVAKRFPKGP